MQYLSHILGAVLLLFFQVENLALSYDRFQNAKRSFCGYFLVIQNKEDVQVDDIKNADQLIKLKPVCFSD